MLENVSRDVADKLQDTTSFNQKYIEYMISMQDVNLVNEVNYLVSYNELTAMRMCKLLKAEFRKLEGLK